MIKTAGNSKASLKKIQKMNQCYQIRLSKVVLTFFYANKSHMCFSIHCSHPLHRKRCTSDAKFYGCLPAWQKMQMFGELNHSMLRHQITSNGMLSKQVNLKINFKHNQDTYLLFRRLSLMDRNRKKRQLVAEHQQQS